MAFYRCGGGADTSVVTAGAEDVLSPKVIVNADGEPITGTMANQGAKTATLSAGGSYTIPKGYHDGNGKVTADSLANQTSATATAEQILYNQTAYVNGNKVTGTMPDMSGFGQSGLPAGASLSIPKGYHNGSGKVTAKTLASQTSATATAAKIMKGYTAWVNGSKITGTKSVTIDGAEADGNLKLVSDLDSYSEVSTLPYNFKNGAAVVYNGEIHILGGSESGTAKYHYKWNGSSWISVSTLPYNFQNGAAVVYNGEIHILGGTSYQEYHYKWNGSSWSSDGFMPYGCSFQCGSAIVYNGEIHVLGGLYSTGGMKSHYKWNGSSWSSASSMPRELYYDFACVYNGAIHAFLLNDASNSYGDMRGWWKWNGSSWTMISTSDSTLNRIKRGASVVCGNHIHVFGSRDSDIYYNNHFKCNADGTLEKAMGLPIDFYGVGVVATKSGDEIHVFYGTKHMRLAKSYRKVV